MTNPLTPYDTGEVLEPVLQGNGFTDCPEDWGKVDFDDDEGMTQAVVSTERSDDGYVMYIEDMMTGATHVIHLKREED